MCTKTTKKPKHQLAKFIALLCIGTALALGIVIIHLTLSRATITITASQTTLITNEEILIPIIDSLIPSEETKTPSPLEELRKTILEASDKVVSPSADTPKLSATVKTLALTIDHTITPEGEGKKVPAKAQGDVTLFNELTFNQPLVATTRLLAANNVLFRLKDRVVVPAEGKITAAIEADQAGEEGNLNATTFTIPGLSPERQKQVYATSEAPFTGGVQIIKTLSEADFERAKQEAVELIKEKALETFNKEDAAVTETQLVLSDIATTSNDKPEEEKEQLTLTLLAKAHAVIVDKGALFEETKIRLSKKATPPYRMISHNEESFSYEITGLNESENTVTLMAYLEGFQSLTPQEESSNTEVQKIVDKRALIGLTAEEIQETLLKNNAIQKVQVTFSPFWVTRAPRITDKITIIIEN